MFSRTDDYSKSFREILLNLNETLMVYSCENIVVMFLVTNFSRKRNFLLKCFVSSVSSFQFNAK